MTAETIDLTPTWTGILPALLAVYANMRPESVSTARTELERMARLADAVPRLREALELAADHIEALTGSDESETLTYLRGILDKVTP
jgi:hypothetical protein